MQALESHRMVPRKGAIFCLWARSDRAGSKEVSGNILF